jgi:hypothetical protein
MSAFAVTDLQLLENRSTLPADDLSKHIQDNFGGSLLSLRQLEPFISEMLRRFKRLPRKVGVDGNRPTIAGCTSFKIWCSTVLHRTDRCVRYMLKRSQSGTIKKTKTEKLSAKHTSARVLKYLDRQLSNANEAERTFLVQEISKTLEGYQRKVA